jgi:pyruvate formate lyase activating enzyme
MDIHIKGVQKVSLIDYPGKISSIVFLNKCNMRCPFCHNPELVFNNDSGGEFPDIQVDEFMSYLDSKKKWIDGVSICGGEPTLHPGLPEFLKMIKDKGLLVKLDTNGTNPLMLKKLIDEKLVDYVAMDVKNSVERYEETTKTKNSIENIKKSIKMIIDTGNKGLIDYEFRATILPKLHDSESIKGIGELVNGAKIFYLQKFRTEQSLVDDSFKDEKTFLEKEMESFKDIMRPFVQQVEFR